MFLECLLKINQNSILKDAFIHNFLIKITKLKDL